MEEENKDLTMVKLPDGKIINKKESELKQKSKCREEDELVTPIH